MKNDAWWHTGLLVAGFGMLAAAYPVGHLTKLADPGVTVEFQSIMEAQPLSRIESFCNLLNLDLLCHAHFPLLRSYRQSPNCNLRSAHLPDSGTDQHLRFRH